MKIVAFFVRHFTERGTEVSTYNYALHNEKILKNKSIIIAFNSPSAKNNQPFINTTKHIFQSKFKIIEIKSIEEMPKIIENEKISYSYIQSHGVFRDYYKLENKKIWKDCVTSYHYVFGPMIRQGSTNRCVLGRDLNKRFRKNLPVLPYIVEERLFNGDLRNELKIPKNAFVYGRHGGFSTFDINFVHQCIKEILRIREDLYFIFLNTKKFYEHKNIIYLERNTNIEFKSKFVSTCDAMIHARKDGETFGLSVAEFSVANKPVITFSNSIDKEHIRILGKKGIFYKNKNELIKIFKNLSKATIIKKDWNAYKEYNPKLVMSTFDNNCLNKKKIFLKDLLLEFLMDLPWEIYNIFKIIKNHIYIFIMNLIPKGIKEIIKKKLF
tara:strand:- start:8364 stop:9509 length:1146 start_codon:yes stop_codon:yes gene_type:complete